MGTQSTENLPKFPFHTLDVIVEEVISVEFVMNTVANDECRNINLKEKLLFKYAIFNLSIVENYEH